MRCDQCGMNKPLAEFDVMENPDEWPICYDCSEIQAIKKPVRIACVILVAAFTALGIFIKLKMGS